MVKNDLKKLYEILKEARYYEHALAILSFDFETIVPNDAREEESAVIDHFDNEIFKLMNSSEYKSLIERLHQNKDQIEDELDKTLVDILYKNYEKEKNLSPEFALKMSNTFSKAYIDWIDAKEKNDYRLFEPALKDVIDIKKQAIERRDNKLADLYDNMLNDCEEGLLQEDLDPFFNELKAGLLNILNKIKNSKHQIRRDFLNRKVQDYQQKEMANYLLELNGYDFNRGVLSETEHPFTMDISQFDARVTTHYYDDMVLSSIYSVIHEGGHAIFMQNEPEEDHKHYINDEISNGMHESVSRFYENVIGRSKEYVHLLDNTNKPYLFLAHIYDDVNSAGIITDNLYAGFTLANFLLDQDCKSIGFVGNIHFAEIVMDRYLGIAKALLHRGLELKKEYIIKDVNDYGEEISLILPDQMPDSFICNDCRTAYKLIHNLEGLEYSIPKDISVAAFDDGIFADIGIPKLTTYSINYNNMAQLAAESIVLKLENPNYHIGKKVVHGGVIIRDSVKKN